MIKRKNGVFVLWSLCLVFSLTVQSSDSSISQQKIDSAIQKYANNHVFSGSVLVAQEGKIIFNKGFGFAQSYPSPDSSGDTPEPTAITNSSNTLFGIGSVTKTITAVMVMQLVERNQLTLNDKVSRFLPELDKAIGDKITIHHLLSHRSGLPNYFEIPGWTSGEFDKSMSLADFTKIIYQLPLKFDPGSDYEYSNSGYFLLGKIIEKVTNKTYLQVLNNNILTPTNMNQTGLQLKNSRPRKLALSYQFSRSSGFEEATINPELFRAAGDLYSTTEDLFRFEQALYNESLLSNESKKILFDKQRSYGWKQFSIDIGKYKLNLMSYSGQLMGYNTVLTRIPENKISIILVGNIGTSYFERINMTQEIIDILYGQDDSSEKLRTSLRLHKALYEGNLSSVIDRIKGNNNFYLDEQGIKSLAQQVGWIGLGQQKKEILKLLE